MSKKKTNVSLKDRFSDTFQRYPVLTTLVIVAILGGLIYAFTRHHNSGEAEVAVEEDVHVDDSLALNIMCIPTLESLPFYHALESGMCDSLHLPLGIVTQYSQMDIDSIMRRTKTIDGAVMDTYRLAYYSKTNRAIPVRESIKLYGSWRLVTSNAQRVKDVDKLKKHIIAASRFDTSSTLLEKILGGKKLGLSDIYLAQINDFAIRANMLDENQVDASILPEPYASLAVSRGHRAVWSDPLMQTMALCFRTKVMDDKRKQEQIELLRRVYNMAVLDLNSRGTHAADSALIKTYRLPKEVIDTLRLPAYRPL